MIRLIDSRNINDLHPTVRRGCLELQRRLKALGYNMGVSSTYRDNAMQNHLYAQGRTRAGSIVTNAKGGQSIHNYRLAFDIFNNVPGNLYPNDFMNLAGKIGREMGFEWGGDWTNFKDKPHFQFTNGLSLSHLQNGRTFSEDILMRWEKEMIEELKKQLEENNNLIQALRADFGEVKKDIDNLKNPTVYKTIDDIPDWGKETIQKLIDKGSISGTKDNNLNLTFDLVRIFVVLDRGGIV